MHNAYIYIYIYTHTLDEDRRPARILEDFVEHVVQVHRQVGQRRRLVRPELHLLRGREGIENYDYS